MHQNGQAEAYTDGALHTWLEQICPAMPAVYQAGTDSFEFGISRSWSTVLPKTRLGWPAIMRYLGVSGARSSRTKNNMAGATPVRNIQAPVVRSSIAEPVVREIRHQNTRYYRRLVQRAKSSSALRWRNLGDVNGRKDGDRADGQAAQAPR